MEKIYRIVELLHKYKAGKLETAEQAELEEWLCISENKKWAESMFTEEYEENMLKALGKYEVNKAYCHFISAKERKKINRHWWWVAAVIFPVMIVMTVVLKQKEPREIVVSETYLANRKQ